ncbi:MAG: DUF4157 domain-containing protein, partial [Chthoniobacterales bacterium]|nr:DUF4157 domain-containing protein [Chthoniobacterales bacterium]
SRPLINSLGRGDAVQGEEPAQSSFSPPTTARIPPIVQQVLRSPGQPLSTATRELMEQRFGHDFAQVRVHTDAKAAESARAVNALAYTVGRDLVFGTGQYLPQTNAGKHLLGHELTHIVQQDNQRNLPGQLAVGPADDVFEREAHQASLNVMDGSRVGKFSHLHSQHSGFIQRQEAPQSFAGGEPGTEVIGQLLVDRNLAIENGLFEAAEEFHRSDDLRWFFAFAHASITQQINQNLSLFQRPNALLRLNIHFAEEFLRAVYGQPHEVWQRAFRDCNALGRGAAATSALVGEAELCGAAMANVHINVDLTAALREVGCIPPSDYSNMLVFVNRGALAALVRLRGQALGAAEAMVQHVIAPLLDLEVRAWRNAAYSSVCNTQVPAVKPEFSSRIDR